MELNTPLERLNVVALAGGVGGARFAHGIAQVIPPENLSVIVNTGDDFQRYTLYISPDLDTVMYTLAGLAHPVNGWGLTGDTQHMLTMIKRYGDDAWFGLNDQDLATHLVRSQALADGLTLTQATHRLAHALGVRSPLLPMTDQPAGTLIDTVEYGVIPFQEYFVRYRWQPRVKRVIVAEGVTPTDAVRESLRNADLILICPSNPLLSILPILNIGEIGGILRGRRVPIWVVSPLIGGQAVKGPAAKLMAEMGLEVSAEGIATYYKEQGLIDGLIADPGDQVNVPGVRVLYTNILMRDGADRARLAREVIEWGVSQTMTWSR